MVSKFDTTWAGRPLSMESGRLAGQADGAVLVRYGDTVVLATVVRSQKQSTLDFFPLTVQYEERMYAAGKIPGGFIRREGRPSENATLSARLTDRPLRPLFPKGYKYEVQVVNTVMSTDQDNEPDLLSIIGSSAALCISDIPFAGPVAAARVGFVNGEYVLNPDCDQRLESQMDLTVAGTADAVLMVEGSAQELPESVMLEAIRFAHESMQPLIELQQRLTEAVGKPKHEFQPPARDEEFAARVRSVVGESLREATNNPNKGAREEAVAVVLDQLLQSLLSQNDENADDLVKNATREFEAMLKEEVRSRILNEGIRPDGRRPEEVRTVSAEVGLLPRTHGSAVFTRGQTQVVSVTTLGTRREEQTLDDLGSEGTKRFMHHYNFPPYSTGETKPMRGPSRRDIGHGALVERSLLQVMPDETVFPYTVRVVSEVVSSNGSSSMGSVCGSTLALMDAGVPIKAPVSGVAMGLVTDAEGRHKVLTDIQGIEDALGDMDLKLAGTENGVTGFQMDLKTGGVTYDILEEAFVQAREARAFILAKMLEAIPNVRGTLSGYAPRIMTIQINPEKIGAVIGPGGKVIRSITETTGAQIDIEDDGSVLIYSADGPSAEEARRRIEAITKDVEVGQRYTGKVVRIMPYGAFVELLPGKDGLVHISELAEGRVERVEDVVKEGDQLEVMVTDIDRGGKVSLSHRAILTGELPAPKGPRPFTGPGPGGPPRGGEPRGGEPRGGERRDRIGDRPPRAPREAQGPSQGFQPSGRGQMDNRG
ncbi:MAG: polyribonucleotide nucleotidyltransferase, partial [Chloroflexota bacterium]|nr:polyribonucleotide nucleotidyltransferase [Chloroflexota bacterium]